MTEEKDLVFVCLSYMIKTWSNLHRDKDKSKNILLPTWTKWNPKDQAVPTGTLSSEEEQHREPHPLCPSIHTACPV